MKLDDLLEGDESVIVKWMHRKGLLHECDCGYTVYDPDEVNSAVQERWGDRRCEEINDWSHGLADQFGWLFLESSVPELAIYHCHHCAGAEFSLLLDLEKVASANPNRAQITKSDPVAAAEETPRERLLVYLDESYSDQFPRKVGGALAYGALILPESQIHAVEEAVGQILKESYRGIPPKELKYSKIAKSGRLLETVGHRVVNLLCETAGLTVAGIFVPRSGFFGERKRSIEAVSHYAGTAPSAAELQDVESPDAVEAAVRDAANTIAQALACCLANHIGARNACAKLIFDPRSKELDEPLINELKALLPLISINVPCLRHGNSIVTNWPHPEQESLGNRVEFELNCSSQDCRGLQIADFLAGDIRAFFSEVDELLDVATYPGPLTNKRVIFPEVFRIGRITEGCMAKLKQRCGKSFVPRYRKRLVNGLISYFTRNGQMRNLNTETGEVFDLMD